MSQMWDWW